MSASFRAAVCRHSECHLRLPLLLIVACWPTLAAAQSDPHPLVATEAQTFALDEPDAMHMPTGLAVTMTGDVFIADGVNSRILHFNADGNLHEDIRQVESQKLSNPVNLHLDENGQLWIVDPGLRQVLVRHPNGNLARTLTFPPAQLAQSPDLTDLTLNAAATIAWLVDNDGHRLLRYNLQTDELRVVGTFGESLGEFHYPYMLATAADGEVLVTDVLNGRVQRLNENGIPTGSVGTYGVDVGQFYRPKSVAVDADQNVWVTDGTLEVVQAFTADGRLIGVLRNPAGQPIELAAPMALDFDSSGHIYIVELLADRVRKFALQRNPEALPPSRTTRQTAAGTTVPQARSCTICHYEWMRPLADGVSTLLAEVPPNPPQHPWVSRSFMCLGCHDASVDDSRERVWVEHGHRTGIVPPPSITIPDHLPLADGEIACRTCHSAHTTPETRTTVAEIVFLRIKESPEDLCTSCHTEYTTGADDGMHPLSAMTGGVPDELLAIHSPTLDETVTCLACHTGHGARHAPLLSMAVDDNALCLKCHEQLAPALFAADQRSRHGQLPALTPTQRAVAQGFDTRIGSDQQLLCVTCHASHQAVTPEFLLAFDPAAQDTCAACHGDRAGVVGSPHDLRTNFPDVENALGVTAREEGACAGCHSAHQEAFTPRPTAWDPAGRCANCHHDDGLAKTAVLTDVNHPDAACRECHDPHIARFDPFLIAPASDLCVDCHEDYDRVATGPHDMQSDNSAWPAASQTAGDRCLACHDPHGNTADGLFRAGLAENMPGSDAACVACHEETRPDTNRAHAMQHPSNFATTADPHGLPMATDDATRMACATCHDPHAGRNAATSLLRMQPGAPTANLCITCHEPSANVQKIGHAESILQAQGFEVGGCKPCHLTHAPSDRVEDRYLWPRALDDFEGFEDVPVADRHCVACHRAGGPVEPPTIATHPEAEMYNPSLPGDPGYLPLFNAAGEVDPQGTVACRTCHLTHGRSDPLPTPADVPDLKTREMRARIWHVRRFGASNVCTTCHGLDALRRFIYFHNPARRSGPIE